MKIEGKYFTDTIPVTTHISIEKKVIDEDKCKIIAIYVDMDYRDLGIETIYDMKELF